MMKPPGWRLPAESRREVDTVRSVQRNVAKHFGAATQKKTEILPERIPMPTRNKKVWVWRNKGNGQFAKTPTHIRKMRP